MYDVHKKVAEIKTDNGYDWNKQCFRLPVVKIIEKGETSVKSRRKNELLEKKVMIFSMILMKPETGKIFL